MSERPSPFSFARRESEGEADGVRKAVTAWRARAIRILLIVVAILGLPAWGAVILNGIRSGQMTPLLWVYLLAYLSILALAFLPHLDYRLRIWGLLLAGYVNGAASLARLGLYGSGRLYLLAVPIYTTILVGARAGLATSLISLAIYGFFLLRAPAPARASWAEAGIALAAFILATVILLARFVQFQLRVLRQEQQARAGLEAAQEELRAYSQTLEEKVLERTALLAEAKEAAEAASRRFEEELLFAGRIQASFMAAHLPDIPSWETGAALVPARETSGDFYDVFPLPDGRYGILIADVVDKGVGAALIMALCWALLHTYARRYPDEPLRVLEATNRRLLRDTQAEQFVTLFYGVLDPPRGTLHYANAGHPPPYQVRGERLSPLPRTGPPIGIVEEVAWSAETVHFQPGDCLLLYTDGVTEAQNAASDFFEGERLAAILQRSAGQEASKIRAAVLDELAGFVGNVPQTDDITLVVLTYSGSADR